MKNNVSSNTPCAYRGSSNFLISILRQENHSWQGSVQWLDSGQKVHFRSELELMNLMNSALQDSQKDLQAFRVWEDDPSKSYG